MVFSGCERDLSDNTLCKDIRDKAYGMLGLVQSELVIKADYSLSVENLCLVIISKRIETAEFWPDDDELWPDPDELMACRRLAERCRDVFQLRNLSDERLWNHMRDQILARWHLPRSSGGFSNKHDEV